MIDILAGAVLFGSCVTLAMIARKYKLFPLVVMLIPLVSFAGVIDCDRTVQDYANALGGRGVAVADASGALINQGVDPRIVTVSTDMMKQYSSNLDFVEKAIESNCVSWRGASGERKSTLLVLMVAPKERKKGIYYGSAWHHALDNNWNHIDVDYMTPRFKDGDFAGGFIAAEQQLAARFKAARSESITGTTVINEASKPADLSWLKWLFCIIGALLVIGIIYELIQKSYQRKQEIKAAQTAAVMARNMAAKGISDFEQEVANWTAQGEIVLPLASSYLDNASREYARLGNSISTDPDTNGLGKSTYDTLARQYNEIGKMITNARLVMTNTKQKQNVETKASVQEPIEYPKSQPYIPPTSPVFAPSAPAPTNPQPSQNVVIVNNERSSYIEPVYIPPVYEEPVHYHHHVLEDDEQSSSSYNSSNDSGGGGSSSWSSSDSSSSDDSSGSSSYDSGGSDSGGGGGDF